MLKYPNSARVQVQQKSYPLSDTDRLTNTHTATYRDNEHSERGIFHKEDVDSLGRSFSSSPSSPLLRRDARLAMEPILIFMHARMWKSVRSFIQIVALNLLLEKKGRVRELKLIYQIPPG